MSAVRLIARLDIKGKNLIKGIQLEGLRVMGRPEEFAAQYYRDGVDELIYMDVVASLYERKYIVDLIQETAKNVFIPITVGGGIRSIDDIKVLLRAGADKIAINTGAIARPSLITESAARFGSQCVVLSVEAKSTGKGTWEAYTDNGRERTGQDAVSWCKEGERLGAGEILLTSVDREGTRKGFDVDLVREVASAVSIPVIASGGMGKMDDLIRVIKDGHADAVAMADVLHYKRLSLKDIRSYALEENVDVRQL